MLNRKWLLVMMFCVISTVLLACGSSGQNPGNIEKAGSEVRPQDQTIGETLKPVTIQMYQFSGSISDEEFKKLMADPVKEKYPHITMEIVREQEGTSLEDAILSGDFPDLIFPGSSLARLIQLEAVQDLTEFIRRHQFNLEKFEQADIEGIRNQSNTGELYALPFSLNFSLLLYNKDIFDRFAVDYPKSEMTWEETIELGRQAARTEEGVTYTPINVVNFNFFYTPLQQALVNPDTHIATLTTEPIANVLRVYQRIGELPGALAGNGRNAFMKDQTIAMMADRGAVLGQIEELHNNGSTLNWDMTTIPSFTDFPGVGQVHSPFLIAIYSNAKHADDAFRALSVIVSEENQMSVTKMGRLSALKDEKFKMNFGSDLQSLKGKNVASMFKYKPAVSPRISDYEGLAKQSLRDAAAKVFSGEEDVNTALRRAEEEANMAISAELNPN